MNSPDFSADRYEDFLRYFSRDRDRIFAYVRSLLPHLADAEDVFQRCSLLLWSKFDNFDRDREFLPWACGIVYYEVRNFLRVAGRNRLQFSGDLIEQLAQAREATLASTDRRMAALRGCLSELKEADSRLIMAAYEEGQSMADYAKLVGRALQTLYNRLSILRRRLLECVERKLAAEGEPG